MFTQLNQYRVVLEIKPDFKRNPDDLKNIYVRSTQGGEVPLDAFSHFEESQTRRWPINHQGQFPVVTASFNLAPGKSLGDAVTAINQGQGRTGTPGQHRRPPSKAPPRRSKPRSPTSRS